jgi:hypothetical protein
MVSLTLLGIRGLIRVGMLRAVLSPLAIRHLRRMVLLRTGGSLATRGLLRTGDSLANPAMLRPLAALGMRALPLTPAALGMRALPRTPASLGIRALLESANMPRIAGSLIRRGRLTIRGLRQTVSLPKSPDLFATHGLPRGGGTG